MDILGWWLAALQPLALCGIAVGAVFVPRKAGKAYGLEPLDPEGTAFLRGLGVRDLSLGLTLWQ